MKTGIITLLGNNYGNRLQNYAVQELLIKYGDVYTVPYEKKVPVVRKISKWKKMNPFYIKEAVDSRLLNLYHLSNRQLNTVTRLIYFLKHREEIKSVLSEREKAFKRFDERYIKYEIERLHLDGDDEETWVKSYDAWVCGSDQIWNPNYPTATRNAFLQFAQPERRISLSASIGLSDVDAMPDEYGNWINAIPYLSVREDAAARIVKELTNREAEVFLDPTMLIPKSYWDKMADEAEHRNGLPGKFALCYFLGIREKEYQTYIAKQLGGKALPSVELLNAQYPEYLAIGPDEMIDAIRKADIVFVDSFHGAVFSILFHKQFVVFERKEAGLTMNSRLQTLLKKFGMEDRVYTGDNAEILEQPIDYSNVDAILAKERQRVQAFLDEAMEKIAILGGNTIKENNKVIEITKKEHCFGCGACSGVCPKQCIKMVPDEEGFLYPAVDKDMCINCGKCSGVCPYHNRRTNDIQKIYATINKKPKVRSQSSSGGTFYEICKVTLEDNGVVYGCAWDENMVAKHIRVTCLKDVGRLQGSKYVQSNLNDSFKQAKEDLLAGKKVVFSGTPCQIAGLKNYLGKDYSNLLLVDVLCHGTPSPKVLAEYIKSTENRFGSKIVNMNLRDKKKSWHRLYTNIEFENGKNYFVFCGYDTYMSMFLNNMSQRPSCFECKFTTATRQGDITLGDFWGIGKHIYDMDDDKGTSMVAINTEKGAKLWKHIHENFIVVESDFVTAESGNKVFTKPPKMNSNRDEFYKDFVEKGYDFATAKWAHIPSKPKQIYYDFMRKGLDFYRLIRHKKY